MTDRLAGLDSAERLACEVAERVLGATAEAHDIDGRQGAVEAFLHYPDGRQAAFEVTRIAAEPAALQLDSELRKRQNSWPLPGQWWWDVWVGHVRELPRLERIFSKIVLMCEQAGAVRPEQLSTLARYEHDPDLRWLLDQSTSTLWGHPDVPAVEGNTVRRATVTEAGTGDFVYDDLGLLVPELVTALATGHVPRRVAKLNRTSVEERHLFLIADIRDLPFAVWHPLAFTDELPPQQPPLPAGITHLWLAPTFSYRVLLGTATGWTQARPYVTE